MLLLCGVSDRWKTMSTKKYSSMENLRGPVVVRKGATRRRMSGVGRRDDATF
jgi:hypothetical protein